jgi:hypothetical protein
LGVTVQQASVRTLKYTTKAKHVKRAWHVIGRALTNGLAAGEERLFCPSEQALELVENFVVLREPADVVLAPDLRAVHVHVEHTAGTFDQLRRHLEGLLDLIRQTGGLGQIVSLGAVFDADLHRRRSSVVFLVRRSSG